jgi:MFS family permease
MFNPGYLKRRLGQYAALWVGAFLLSGAAILIGLMFADLMVAIDRVLPILLGGAALGLGVGVVLSLVSGETPGTKLAVLLLALLLALPLLWAPVSAAVAIAFFADRSIEYSESYAAFQIGVSRVLFPIGEALGDGDLFGWVWTAFQWVSTVVGFFSAVAKIWPAIRRMLGPEPVTEG